MWLFRVICLIQRHHSFKKFHHRVGKGSARFLETGQRCQVCGVIKVGY
jgi:hypothetical protein